MNKQRFVTALAAAIPLLCGTAAAQPGPFLPAHPLAMPHCGWHRPAVLRTGYRPSADARCCGAGPACGQLLSTVAPLTRPRLRG